MDLSRKKCTPCEGGTPPLDKDKVAEYKKQIQAVWNVTTSKKLSREYAFADFKHTMDFVNRVADLAEEEGHHPVMHVHYSKVIIELWTHDIGGLSENDFIMASKIEKL
ncbi:MAG: 4a-hydroxytetrahydrobiopterin dehydratase [Bacteroidales bacterium]|nr:4a-hydroxytetrahydrobiopterin dehydratase [Bacteroidales bacterium]